MVKVGQLLSRNERNICFTFFNVCCSNFIDIKVELILSRLLRDMCAGCQTSNETSPFILSFV